VQKPPSYEELTAELATLRQHEALYNALRESEERYRQMFEGNQAVKLVIDPQSGAIVDANPAACAFYGYRSDQLRGMPIAAINLLPAADLQRELANAATEQRSYFLFQHRLASGEIRDVEVYSSPITVQGRSLLFSIIHDITERMQVAASYRLLFENNPQALWVYDRQTLRFLAVNATAIARYGWTRDEFLTMTIAEIRPPEDLPALQASIARDEPGTEYAGVWRHCTKAGALLWVEIISHPLVFEGHPARLVISTDVTARQQAEDSLRETQARYRDLVENASDIIYTHDLYGHLLSINAVAVKTYGYAPDEWLHMNINQVIDPAYRGIARAQVQPLIRTGGQTEPHEILTRTKDGRPIWVEVIARVLHEQGRAVSVQGIAREITARKQAEAQLRLQATALESAANAIMIADQAGIITWVNPAFTRLTGYAAEDAIGQPTSLLDSGQQDPEFNENLWQTIRGGQVWHGEMVNRRQDGSLYSEEQTVTPVLGEQGDITHFITIKQDITERKHNEQQISYLASHDPLTGLLNRRALEENLDRAVARGRRGQESALLFLDMDNFKLVNDTLGHTAGDQLLVTLTGILAEQLRDGDLLTRLGGDDFAVLLEGTELAAARQIADAMLTAVDTFQFRLGGRSFELSLSIGLVPVTGQQSSQVLLAQADTAMHSAKAQGGNRTMLYHPEEDSLVQLSEANQWIRRIKDALRADRLVLYFQPVVRLSDNRIAHYEALIRMCGDNGELILPGAFISAAERFGLMPPIDRWVLRSVIETLQLHPGIQLFMNLSGRSLVDEGLLEFIEQAVRESGVAPDRLGFEITETAAVQDLVRAERWIRELKALGCHFALDDFGVGFTSFAYLRSLPVDQIKIDGSFIRTLDEDPSNRHIVQAMHTLARSLGKETVAEFVETAAIVDILREIGVTYGQGFYQGKAERQLPGPPV